MTASKIVTSSLFKQQIYIVNTIKLLKEVLNFKNEHLLASGGWEDSIFVDNKVRKRSTSVEWKIVGKRTSNVWDNAMHQVESQVQISYIHELCYSLKMKFVENSNAYL